MLSLQLKSGEYFTIGDDIVIQVFEQTGTGFRVAVKAPKELPILRGEVLERNGDRPDGLLTKRPQSPSERQGKARRFKEFKETRDLSQTKRISAE